MKNADLVAALICGMLGAIAVGMKLVGDKLDRVIALLERRND